MSNELEIKELYNAMPGSPITSLVDDINNEQDYIEVNNTNNLPSPPNIATLYSGTNFETILYTAIDGNTLKNVTRGLDGDARQWAVNTSIARTMTSRDLNHVQNNLNILQQLNLKLTNLKKENITDVMPSNPEDDEKWYNPETNELKIYDANNEKWEIEELETGGGIQIVEKLPEDPEEGSLIYSLDEYKLKIYKNSEWETIAVMSDVDEHKENYDTETEPVHEYDDQITTDRFKFVIEDSELFLEVTA